MKSHLRHPAALTIAAALLLGANVAPIAAQEDEPRDTGPSVEQISDSRLEQITTAYVEILEIQNEFQAQIEQSATPEEANRYQEQANERILGTLEALGIAPDEYAVVMRAANEQPEFQQRFLAMLQKVQSEQQEEPEEESSTP